MRIKNNTNTSISVSDINIIIPISKIAFIDVKSDILAESKQIISLLNSGKISIENDGVDEVKELNGKYVVSGNVIWDGNGKVKTYQKTITDREKSVETIKNLLAASRRPKVKYKLRRKTGFNVSLESIRIVLTRSVPECIVTEEDISKIDIQRAISSNLVEVVERFKEIIDVNGNTIKVSKEKEDVKKNIFVEKLNNTEYSGMECFWEGPIFDSGGYANMNRQYVLNLRELGVNVIPSLIETTNDIEQNIIEELKYLSTKGISRNSPKIFATNVPQKHIGPSIAYTMMETERMVHPDLEKHMSIAKELWVPSEWNREIFSHTRNIKKNIYVMPLGVDCDLYLPREPKVQYSFPIKNFVFYSSSTWLWRKGFDILLKAYSRAFSADDDVSLIIFTKHSINKIIADIKSFVDNKNNLPHLAVINSVLPTKVMPYMYNSIDAFVLFSRGEGWGLPYCEAAASGVPIIGANHGGQKMFLNDENSFLVTPDRVVSCPLCMMSVSPFYRDMYFVDYSDKVVNLAAEKMRYVYDHREEAKQKAEICKNNIVNNFTWKKAALRVANRLREIK